MAEEEGEDGPLPTSMTERAGEESSQIIEETSATEPENLSPPIDLGDEGEEENKDGTVVVDELDYVLPPEDGPIVESYAAPVKNMTIESQDRLDVAEDAVAGLMDNLAPALPEEEVGILIENTAPLPEEESHVVQAQPTPFAEAVALPPSEEVKSSPEQQVTTDGYAETPRELREEQEDFEHGTQGPIVSDKRMTSPDALPSDSSMSRLPETIEEVGDALHTTDGYVETPRELREELRQENPIIDVTLAQALAAREADERARKEEEAQRLRLKELKRRQVWAATKIQSQQRRLLASQRVSERRARYNRAALKIQSQVRRRHAGARVRQKRIDLTTQKQLHAEREANRLRKEQEQIELAEEELQIQAAVADLEKKEREEEEEENRQIEAAVAALEEEEANKEKRAPSTSSNLSVEDESDFENLDNEEFPEPTPSEAASNAQGVAAMQKQDDKTLDVALGVLRDAGDVTPRLQKDEDAIGDAESVADQYRYEHPPQASIPYDPVELHSKMVSEDGRAQMALHGPSPPARTPARMVSTSPVLLQKRWQNASCVLIQSVWRGSHFRRKNRLMLVAIARLKRRAVEEQESTRKHQEDLDGQLRDFNSVQLILSMEQRKRARLEGFYGQAQREYEEHMANKAAGYFVGFKDSGAASIRPAHATPKKGPDVPFTVHAQHEARKRAEGELAKLNKKIKRMNYTIKQLMAKLSADRVEHKKRKEEEVAQIREEMIKHEHRSQNQIARLTSIIDHIGRDDAATDMHKLPPVSSASQANLVSFKPMESVATSVDSEMEADRRPLASVGSWTIGGLDQNRGIKHRNDLLSRTSVSLPALHDNKSVVSAGPDSSVGVASSVNHHRSSNARRFEYAASPLVQRIASIGDEAQASLRSPNKKTRLLDSPSASSTAAALGPKLWEHTTVVDSPSASTIAGRSARRSSRRPRLPDKTIPTAAGLGTKYKAGSMSTEDLRRIYL